MKRRAPLDRLDDRFHAVYDRTRGETAHSEPVLVVFGDSLFFYRQGRRQEHGMASAQAQLLKAAAHVPVGVYLTMRQLVGRAVLDDGAQRELRRLLRLCLEERDARDSSLGDAIATEMATVRERCVDLLSGTLETRRVDDTALRAFATELGPRLLRLAEEATRRQLSTLHELTGALLADLPPEDRAALRVVVAGAHQARVRSLPMQYFQKLFAEAPGVEERVLYAEAVTDADAARQLVGTHLLDREIAGAFFGDPRRLQRDVLGDIAAAMLESAPPARR